MQIIGDYYEVNKSQKHDAVLVVTPDHKVSIKASNKPSNLMYQNVDFTDVEISSRLAHTPRVVTFPDGSVFETSENDEIDQWLKGNDLKNSLGWIHYLESRLAYVFLTLVFVVIFSWGFIQFGVPSIADATAKILPNEVNQYLGKGTLTLLDESYFASSELSEARQSELLSKFNRYTNDYESLNIKVVFRHGGKVGANAFALPDGHVVFTDEMVELSKEDEELIAILGHEIGHLDRRHLLRRVIQDSLLASLVVLITGDISYASTAVIAVPALLLELAYSRQFEEEADEFALAFLNKHKIPAEHFAHIMTRLSENDELKDTDHDHGLSGNTVTEYLSSHPVTKERIKPFLIEPAI